MGAASITRFLTRVDGRVGAGLSGEGITECRVDLVIGRRDGAVVGNILASLAAPPPHAVALLVRTPVGDLVRPATILVNNSLIDGPVMEQYVRGPAQLGVAEAVDGAVARRELPPNLLYNLTLLVVVALSRDLSTEPMSFPYELRIRQSSRQATKDAIDSAMEGLSLVGVTAGTPRPLFGEPGASEQ